MRSVETLFERTYMYVIRSISLRTDDGFGELSVMDGLQKNHKQSLLS